MNKNLFKKIQPPTSGEKFVTLFENKNLLIEKIISSNRIKTKIYKQKHDEWVCLLKGAATIRVEKRLIGLRIGDHILIKKNQEHEVVKARQGTVWLAIHIKN